MDTTIDLHPRATQDTSELNWPSFSHVCFVTSVNYKDLFSSVVLTGPRIEKPSSGEVSINMLLISMFGPQARKSTRAEARLSGSVFQCLEQHLGYMSAQHLFNKWNRSSQESKVLQWKECFFEKMNNGHANLKVLILKTFQMYLLNVEATLGLANSETVLQRWWSDPDFIQYLLRTYNMPDTLAWGTSIPQTWQTPEAVAVGFYIMCPKCQISRCIRAACFIQTADNPFG